MFNAGTAAGSWIAGLALSSTLGVTGPAAVGSVIAALTLIPTVAMALQSSVGTATSPTPAPPPARSGRMWE